MESIKKLKKIELHLHLDGSVSVNLASKLANISYMEAKKRMVAPSKCLNLKEYLTKFNFVISLMQTKKNLSLIAKNLAKQLEEDNVLYAEVRFAPFFHTKKGLTQEEVVKAVLNGFKKSSVKTNLILCLMRGVSEKNNKETIEVAEKYLGKGVVAIDLAGDEKKYKLNSYKNLFLSAKEKQIPFTIHAGEVDIEDIEEAIQLGVKRIGHGVKCIDNMKLLKQIKEKNILLEICPTSNIQTNAFLSIDEHPIYDFYKNKINISINTDNRTVSNISLNSEYLKLIKHFSFTIEDFKKINKNTVNYTFLSAEEKIDLLEKLNCLDEEND